MGSITQVQSKSTNTVYTIDDGTGHDPLVFEFDSYQSVVTNPIDPLEDVLGNEDAEDVKDVKDGDEPRRRSGASSWSLAALG